MTPSSIIVLVAFSLIASDIIPSEARYKSYQRRRASRYLTRQQRRQIDDLDFGGITDSVGISNSLAQKLSDMLIAAVSQAISTVVSEQPFINCPGMRRRNSNSNFNYNSNMNSIIDPIGQKSADFDTVDEDELEAEPAVEEDTVGDDLAEEEMTKRSSKRRQLKARRNRNRNTNVNVNQNYNLSARKEETNTNPSAEGSSEDESTTELPKIASRHRRRNNFK